MPWTTQPEPNLFVKQTITMSETPTHCITMSNPVLPEEPQPRIEESLQQPSTEMLEAAPPVVVIQPPPSGEETGEPTKAETDVISLEHQKKKKKKEKKAKKDKQAKHQKQQPEQFLEEPIQTTSQVLLLQLPLLKLRLLIHQ